MHPAFLKALEVIGSPLHRLRVALHLEAAKCDAAEDSLIKASQEVCWAGVIEGDVQGTVGLQEAEGSCTVNNWKQLHIKAMQAHHIIELCVSWLQVGKALGLDYVADKEEQERFQVSTPTPSPLMHAACSLRCATQCVACQNGSKAQQFKPPNMNPARAFC